MENIKRLEVKRFVRTRKLALLQKIMETKESINVSMRTIYNRKRKEHGLCVKCGKPMDRDGTYCTGCRQIINEKVRSERKWYKDHGICPRCRKVELMGDENMCPECCAKEYEYNMKSRNKLGKDYINEQHKKHSKKVYYDRIEKGLCTRCGKRKADHGLRTCGICRAKDAETRRIRCAKPDKSERWKNGLCYFCDKPIKEGYKVCEYHYQKNVENARSGRASQAREKLLKEGILY